MTYVKQTWIDGPGGGTPISAARLNYMETGIANTTQLLPPATGLYATDNTLLQAALNAFPSQGGRLVLSNDLSAGGIYVVERLTVSNLEYLEIDGQGSTIQLADDDGLGGLGQILLATNVVKFVMRNVNIDGNYAGAKTGDAQNPLIKYLTTSATIGRKDFQVILDRVTVNESAKGWGQFMLQVHETNASTYSEFSSVIVRDFRSTASGSKSNAMRIRGPARYVSIDGYDSRNDGEYGLVAVGVPTGGSNTKSLGISCDITFNHYVRLVQLRNVNCFRTGGLFFQMVKQLDGTAHLEESMTNPYYNVAPVPFTVDPATDILTATVPAGGYGDQSLVRVTTTGTLPTPLVAGNLYHVRSRSGNTFKLSTKNTDANIVNLTDVGTGTHSIEFMGMTYDAVIKGDDNNHSTADPCIHTWRSLHIVKSSPHSSTTAFTWEESLAANMVGQVCFFNSSLDHQVELAKAAVGIRHYASDSKFKRSYTNVADPTTRLQPIGGDFVRCEFDAGMSLSGSRDLTFDHCRFETAPIISSTDSRQIEMNHNVLNTGDSVTQRIEIVPPATGKSLRLVIRGNRSPVGATQQTLLRISSSGDVAGLEVESYENYIGTDTTVGQATNPLIRWNARGNRIGRRGTSDFPTTLANSATPSIAGDSAFITGGTTAITNFTNGINHARILVYIAATHQVNNTATIVTKSSGNIVGPAVRQFQLFSGVWYEL